MRPSVRRLVAAVAALAISAAGAGTASAAAPSNDAFSAATPLALDQQISSTNLDATVEAGEPNAASVSVSGECGAFTDGPTCGSSVWYAFTPAATGQVTIETCDRGTDMDTVLGVYTGATIGAAAVVDQNDDACPGGFSSNGSRVTFTAAAGTTYHVDVTGFDGEMGSFYLRAYSGPGVARPNPDTVIQRSNSEAIATNALFSGSVLTGPRHTPSFSFISTPAGATFECSLDGAAFTGCSSPVAFDPLASGDHTFAVRAGAGGSTDPTPVIERFTIDTTPPETALLSGPSGNTASTTAQWGTASSERTGTGFNFICHFDGQRAIGCARNQTFTSLCMGPHTFDSAAWDRGLNLDPTPVDAAINVTTGTACAPPTVGTTTTTTPQSTTAFLLIPVDGKGAGATLRFEYGKTTSYGQELRPQFVSPGSTLTGESLRFLDPGTTYHYRVTITSPFGTQTAADQMVDTNPLAGTLPAVQTDDPVSVGHYAVRLPVRVDPTGVDTVYSAYVEPAGQPVGPGSPNFQGDDVIPGTSTGPQAGAVAIVDLEPGKSYDYRIAARHLGSDANEVLGPTRTFMAPDFSSPSGGSTGGGGGGGGGGATTPAVPVIGPTAGVASLAARTAKVRKGKVELRLRCSSAGPCAGSLEIDATGASAARKKKKPKKAVVARGRYSVAAGTTATVKVPLTAKGKRLLRKHHGKLTTKLILRPTGAAATTSKLTLKQVPTKRKKPKRRH